MISDNQWQLIGKYMDETAKNLQTITTIVVVSFLANIFAGIYLFIALS